MTVLFPDFRNPAERVAYDAVLADLAGRDRGEEAAVIFREPIDPEAAVIADAIIRVGTISDDQYAGLLALADRRHDHSPVTRAVAFDGFGTLVRIGRKRHPFERVIRQARDRAAVLPSPTMPPRLDCPARMPSWRRWTRNWQRSCSTPTRSMPCVGFVRRA